MIAISTEDFYLEELNKFLKEMGGTIKISPDRHWQTMGEVEHPGRNGEICSTHIGREGHDDYSWTYEIRIHSTPGFEQKLLVRARKWAIAVIGKGTVKPFHVYYNPKC